MICNTKKIKKCTVRTFASVSRWTQWRNISNLKKVILLYTLFTVLTLVYPHLLNVKSLQFKNTLDVSVCLCNAVLWFWVWWIGKLLSPECGSGSLLSKSNLRNLRKKFNIVLYNTVFNYLLGTTSRCIYLTIYFFFNFHNNVQVGSGSGRIRNYLASLQDSYW
jgi:hypothetical protein